MISHYKRELSVALAYLFLLLILALFAPSFYKSGETREILVQSAPVLIAAIGMTLVILARHIDISIGSQFAICGITAGLLAKARLPMPLVALGSVCVGAAMGAMNGALVAGLGLPSIVVTLATMFILGAGLEWWQHGAPVGGLAPDFQWLGLGQDIGKWLIVVIALGVFALFATGLRYLAAGRMVYATGSDADAARLAGIRPQRVVFLVFVVMGALTGLAALLSVIQLRLIYPNEGEGLELRVIAAVVVGGVAISGGRGSLLGPLLGVALLGTIRSALVFLGTEPQWEKAIQGAIILIAVAAEALNRSRRKDVGASIVTP